MTENPPSTKRDNAIEPTLTPTGTETPTVRDYPPRIGRYLIRKMLGKGGMGVVYLAYDDQMQREVALKVPNFRRDEDPAAIERFYREARTAGRLQHPNICPVYDVDHTDGIHHLSMAYIEGDTLAQHVGSYAARPPQEAATLVRTLALALEEAHRQGIIHRDLKPQNIMINRRGEPIVMDFGLAREIKSATSDLSHPGMVMGTPAYISPEQARGDLTAMGPGCDIYSLGVVLYQLLIGRVPFEGTTMDVIAKHLRDDPLPLSSLRRGMDPRIEAICMRAMAKEPCQRFLSMAEVAQALEDFLHGQTTVATCVSLAERDEFEETVAQALLLLRKWGWKKGLEVMETALWPEALKRADERIEVLHRILQGDGTAIAAAPERFRGMRFLPALIGWALVNRAGHYNRERAYDAAADMLQKAEEQGDPRDNILQAEIAHERGFYLFHTGKLDESLNYLHAALDLCGRDHVMTGWVLERLGLVYAGKNNFHAARELIGQSIQSFTRFGDHKARARMQGHLGKLHLDWGNLSTAEEQFQQSLLASQKMGDLFGQGAMYDYLGQIALRRGEREAETGHKATAKRFWNEAADLFEAAIRTHQKGGDEEYEGYAHKDRARLAIAQGDLDQAERSLSKAEELFRKRRFEKGLAHARLTSGILKRLRGDWTAATQDLQLALNHFDQIAMAGEATLAQLEIARTLAAGEEVRQLTSRAYVDALKRAEVCRRDGLVVLIEDELKGVDEEAHWKHVFHRSRGRGATTRTGLLDAGESEVASVLFLNLVGFVPFSQGFDSADVLRTLNQMMSDLTEVLERHQGFVTSYLGGGFMALIRGQAHEERAVQAALDMIEIVNEFNRPRSVLGLRQLPVRIGVASGSLFLGNIGTYYKMDFTAVGMPVNLAARLLRQTDASRPCIALDTYEKVRHRFDFAEGNPRTLDLPGIGRREVWDVLGRKK